MTDPEIPEPTKTDLDEVAQTIAETTRRLVDAMDDRRQETDKYSDELNSSIEETKKRQEQRRAEVENKREQIRQKFSRKWKRY